MRHIIDEFHRVALVHSNIAFSLFSNGSELFNLPSSNSRQRIVNIFGGKTNEKLVPINEETEIVTVTGFVGKPEFGKKNRGEQFFFVNDRFIKNGYLHHYAYLFSRTPSTQDGKRAKSALSAPELAAPDEHM